MRRSRFTVEQTPERCQRWDRRPSELLSAVFSGMQTGCPDSGWTETLCNSFQEEEEELESQDEFQVNFLTVSYSLAS